MAAWIFSKSSGAAIGRHSIITVLVYDELREIAHRHRRAGGEIALHEGSTCMRYYMYVEDSAAQASIGQRTVQVYLGPADRDLLNRLVAETGLTKAEILRQGMRSFAREQGGTSPMLRFIAESAQGEWPEDVAEKHDEILAQTYRGPASLADAVSLEVMRSRRIRRALALDEHFERAGFERVP